jgi:hypothetical protein
MVRGVRAEMGESSHFSSRVESESFQNNFESSQVESLMFPSRVESSQDTFSNFLFCIFIRNLNTKFFNTVFFLDFFMHKKEQSYIK